MPDKNIYARFMIDNFLERYHISDRPCWWQEKQFMAKTKPLLVINTIVEEEKTLSESIIDIMQEENPEAYLVEGFNDCITGIGKTAKGAVFIYSETLIIEKLMLEMSEEQAIEYYDFNILNAYFGDFSPVFQVDIVDEE